MISHFGVGTGVIKQYDFRHKVCGYFLRAGAIEKEVAVAAQILPEQA
jgi:hypothetical protein